MMYWGHGMGIGGLIFGGLLMLLFWALVIGLVVWVIRSGTRNSNRTAGFDRVDRAEAPAGTANERALQIAQERYARGEITKQEYEEIRQTLRG